MLRKMFSYSGTLLLAGVALFVTPGLGQAQHGGGGHGGGGHVGGGHFGGAHFSGGHMGGAHFGGYRGGFYHGGGGVRSYHFNYPRSSFYHPGYDYRHFGYRYGGFGYYPYFNDYPYYDSYPYTYDTYPDFSSSPSFNTYYGSYQDVMPSYADGNASVTPPAAGYQSLYPPATAPAETSAHVTVNVPDGAELWFDDTPTTTTGSVRAFNSPPLTPGSRYSYDIRARWNENGHEVTQTQHVQVTAGAHIQVDFPIPPKTAEQASAVKRG